MREAAAEQEKLDNADQAAGKWRCSTPAASRRNSGRGRSPSQRKKGDAYPATFDFTPGGGPTWTGVGHYALVGGDKTFWVAYGTRRRVALCVYDIDGGNAEGKVVAVVHRRRRQEHRQRNPHGPASLDGDFKITAGKSPTTGAEYTGTVTIKPAEIVGATDDASRTC